jgi:uncharacterized protein (TIGR02217 family)
MSFHDVRFPTDIAYGSVGGPAWSTTVIALRSGAEARNANWSAARYTFNVAAGIKTPAQHAVVVGFFHARRGRLHGFRFKDHADFSSAGDGVSVPSPVDQALGLGPTSTFQLAKTYADAGGSWVRTITRPVAGSVRVAIAGIETLAGDATYPWSLGSSGVLTFTLNAPPGGQSVTAGFLFDVPVRFDTDRIPWTWEDLQALGSPDIPIIEIREC